MNGLKDSALQFSARTFLSTSRIGQGLSKKMGVVLPSEFALCRAHGLPMFPLKSLHFQLFGGEVRLCLFPVRVVICQCRLDLRQRQLRILVSDFFGAISLLVQDNDLVYRDACAFNVEMPCAYVRRTD